MRPLALVAVAALSVALSGCGSAMSRYTPSVIARGELALRYDGGFELWAAGTPIASGPRYQGLSEFVRCVPDARRHAEAAEDAGSQAVGFSVTAGGLAVVGLGGLAGLAFQDTNRTVMAALLLSGIGVEVLGVVFAGLGRQAKVSARGHAIDAMNYYNDAVGSLGGSCADPSPVPPPAEPAPPNPAPSEGPGAAPPGVP